jgi:hypothetical protein
MARKKVLELANGNCAAPFVNIRERQLRARVVGGAQRFGVVQNTSTVLVLLKREA